MVDAKPTRWGIVGCGKISSDFTSCLLSLSPSHHKIVAAVALTLEIASEFGNKYGILKTYGSSLELAQDNNVEIVHVGVTNENHFEMVLLMLRHGKHVLCEKPMGMNASQTKAMISLAREKNLFLMEGMWSRFFPVYDRLRQELSSGSLGDILQVNATLGLSMNNVDRIASRKMGGGALMDIGTYTLALANLVFQGRKPVNVTAAGHVNGDGVDEAVLICLVYDDGAVACLNVSSRALLVNDAYVVGTNGIVKLESPFWCPTVLSLPGGQNLAAPLPDVTLPLLHTNSAGLVYEAQEVRRCLLSGENESPFMTLDETQYLADLRDVIRRQVGLVFECDSSDIDNE